MLLRIWDLGGQRQFRTLWQKFSVEASGIIFVLDSTSDRWAETKEAFEIAKSLNLPLAIFANKQDEVGTAREIEYIAEQIDSPSNLIIPGSALLNQGVPEILDRLIEVIHKVDPADSEKIIQISQ